MGHKAEENYRESGTVGNNNLRICAGVLYAKNNLVVSAWRTGVFIPSQCD